MKLFNHRSFLFVVCISAMWFCACASSKGTVPSALQVGKMYVYYDYGFSDNHYVVKARIAGEGEHDLVKDMNEDYKTNPYSGNSCIKCEVNVSGRSWGGWMFTHGYYKKDGPPELSFGQYPDCGYDLSKAGRLTFMAKGMKGGEKVEFFTAGLGWNPDTKLATEKYPDSSQKITLGIVELTPRWTEYTIPLEGADLSYISCGFGFVVSGNYNTSDVTFYLDDIKYLPFREPRCELPPAIIVAIIGAIGAIIAALIGVIRKRKS